MRNKIWSLVAGVALAAACGSATKKPAPPAVVAEEPRPASPPAVADEEPALPAIPASPVPAPASVLATGVIANPAATIAGVAVLADAVEPGAGAKIDLDALVALAAEEGVDLAGADLRRPVRIVMLDPSQFNAPVVVVVGVGDQAALAAAADAHGVRIQLRDGFAAIGTFDALTEVGGYALTTLLATPAPVEPTVTVNVHAAWERYGSFLETMGGQLVEHADPAKRASTKAMVELYLSLFAQLERLEVALELGADRATVTARLAPAAGSTVAAFVGRQTPSRFTLVERLPAGAVVIGGRLDLDQVWTALLPAISDQLAASNAARGPKFAAVYQAWMAVPTGEYAVAAEVLSVGVGVAGLWETPEPARLVKVWTDYMDATFADSVPGSAIKASTAKHRGAKVAVVTAKPGKRPPPAVLDTFATFGGALGYGLGTAGKHMVFTLGADPGALARPLIDLSKDGPKRPPTAVQSARAPVVAEARRRGESYLVAVDVAALAVLATRGATSAPAPAPAAPLEPAVFAIGTAGDALTARFTMTAAQAKILASR